MNPHWLKEILDRIAATAPRLDTTTLLVVLIDDQRLHLVRDGRIERSWPVSTAACGIGAADGSQMTPPGLHRIHRKIGAGLPPGAVLRGRVATGEVAPPEAGGEGDLITARILWLEGMEAGVNRGPGIDSCDRHIYIHGTGDEGRIGSPVSHGCVRMRDADVIELHDLVAEGTPVVIYT